MTMLLGTHTPDSMPSIFGTCTRDTMKNSMMIDDHAVGHPQPDIMPCIFGTCTRDTVKNSMMIDEHAAGHPHPDSMPSIFSTWGTMKETHDPSVQGISRIQRHTLFGLHMRSAAHCLRGFYRSPTFGLQSY